MAVLYYIYFRSTGITEREEHTETHHTSADARRIGYFALDSTLRADTLIATPAGDIAVSALAKLFRDCIAPPRYFPDFERPENKPPIRIDRVGLRTLQINGRKIEFNASLNLFPLNALFALRNNPRGVTRQQTYDIGYTFTGNSAPSAWHYQMNVIRGVLEGAAEEPIIQTISANRYTSYQINPRVELIDCYKPRFDQEISTRLLSLENRQVLRTPFSEEPYRVRIIGDTQIHTQGEPAELSRDARALLNLLRLTDGDPLTYDEVFTAGFHGHGKGKRPAYTVALAETIRALNDLLDDGRGIPAIVTDAASPNPNLIRLRRSIQIMDMRDTADTDQTMRGDLASILEALHHLPTLEGYELPNEIERALTISSTHRNPIRLLTEKAFAAHDISLKDAYLLSVRGGVWLSFLEHTKLPLLNGERLPYKALESLLQEGEPLSIKSAGHILSMEEHPFWLQYRKAVKKISATAERLATEGDILGQLALLERKKPAERLAAYQSGKVVEQLLDLLPLSSDRRSILLDQFMPNEKAPMQFSIILNSVAPLRHALTAIRTEFRTHLLHKDFPLFSHYAKGMDTFQQLIGDPGSDIPVRSYSQVRDDPEFTSQSLQALADIVNLLEVYLRHKK